MEEQSESDVALHKKKTKKNPHTSVLSPQFGFELRLKSVRLFVKENTERSSWQVRSPFSVHLHSVCM